MGRVVSVTFRPRFTPEKGFRYPLGGWVGHRAGLDTVAIGKMVCLSGPHYPLGTVPRAYDIFKAYEGIEGRKNKN
jgi:hypothetical protein